MIEVTEDELAGPGLKKGVEKGNRVAPSRDSKQVATARREARIEEQRHFFRAEDRTFKQPLARNQRRSGHGWKRGAHQSWLQLRRFQCGKTWPSPALRGRWNTDVFSRSYPFRNMGPVAREWKWNHRPAGTVQESPHRGAEGRFLSHSECGRNGSSLPRP